MHTLPSKFLLPDPTKFIGFAFIYDLIFNVKLAGIIILFVTEVSEPIGINGSKYKVTLKCDHLPPLIGVDTLYLWPEITQASWGLNRPTAQIQSQSPSIRQWLREYRMCQKYQLQHGCLICETY